MHYLLAALVLVAGWSNAYADGWQFPATTLGQTVASNGSFPYITSVVSPSTGQVTALWVADDPAANRIFLSYSTKPQGGTFATRQHLDITTDATGMILSPTLLIDDLGNITAVWVIESSSGMPYTLKTATMALDSTSFGPPTPIATATTIALEVTVIDALRNLNLVWLADSSGTYQLLANTLPQGGVPGVATTLDSSTVVGGISGLQFVSVEDGDKTLIWVLQPTTGAGTQLRTATMPLGGSFGSTTTIGLPTAAGAAPIAETQLALDSINNAVAAWSIQPSAGAPYQLQTATRPQRGVFGPSQAVATGTAVTNVQLALQTPGVMRLVWEIDTGSANALQTTTAFQGGTFAIPVMTLTSTADGTGTIPSYYYVVDTTGNTTFFWVVQPTMGSAYVLQIATATPTSLFTVTTLAATTDQTGSITLEVPTVNYEGDVTGLWAIQPDSTMPYAVQAITMRYGGTLQPIQTLASNLAASQPQLAGRVVADPMGNAVAAWVATPMTGGPQLQMAVQPVQGTFATPQLLSNAQNTTGSITINDLFIDNALNTFLWWTFNADSLAPTSFQSVVEPLGGTFESPTLVASTIDSTGGIDVVAASTAEDPWGNDTAFYIITPTSSTPTMLNAVTYLSTPVMPRMPSLPPTQTVVQTTDSSGRITAPMYVDVSDTAGNVTTFCVLQATSTSPPQLLVTTQEARQPFATPPMTISQTAAISGTITLLNPVVDSNGNVTAVWLQRESSTSPLQLMVVTRSRGGDFSIEQPIAMASDPTGAIVAADPVVDPSGTVTVVWAIREMSTMPLEIWGVTVQEGFPGTSQQLATASDPTGKATLGSLVIDIAGNVTAQWTLQPIFSQPAMLQAATKPAGGAFGTTQTVTTTMDGTGTIIPDLPIVQPTGTVVALYSIQPTSSSPIVLNAISSPSGGTFGAPQQLASTTNWTGSLAFADPLMDAAGRVTALWTMRSLSSQPALLQVAVMPQGGLFGSPLTQVTTSDYTGDIRLFQPAIDAHGMIVAFWQLQATAITPAVLRSGTIPANGAAFERLKTMARAADITVPSDGNFAVVLHIDSQATTHAVWRITPSVRNPPALLAARKAVRHDFRSPFPLAVASSNTGFFSTFAQVIDPQFNHTITWALRSISTDPPMLQSTTLLPVVARPALLSGKTLAPVRRHGRLRHKIWFKKSPDPFVVEYKLYANKRFICTLKAQHMTVVKHRHRHVQYKYKLYAITADGRKSPARKLILGPFRR